MPESLSSQALNVPAPKHGHTAKVWAFAKMEIYHRPFFGALAVDIAAKVHHFQQQNLVNVLWASRIK